MGIYHCVLRLTAMYEVFWGGKRRFDELAKDWKSDIPAIGAGKVFICILSCQRVPKAVDIEVVFGHIDVERRRYFSTGFAKRLGKCAHIFHGVYDNALHLYV